MALTRWIVSRKDTATSLARDSIVNTLYFNVSQPTPVDEIDFDSLGNDLWTICVGRPWWQGCYLDLRGYNMEDAEPRPQKFHRTGTIAGTFYDSPRQVALCLSYYADRNLAGQRGRLYLGPWTTSGEYASTAQTDAVIALPPLLAGLGGVNVDWSLWSPTKNTHTRISDAWVDDSWDIIRKRKMPAKAARKTWSGNG